MGAVDSNHHIYSPEEYMKVVSSETEYNRWVCVYEDRPGYGVSDDSGSEHCRNCKIL